MSRIESIKTYLRNIDWGDIDFFSSIALKITALLFLLFLSIALLSIKQQYAHSGPDCDDYKDTFQYWISNNKKNTHKILSVETSRVQVRNGTTTCYGSYVNGQGEYHEWSGVITLLDNGEIIGRAN